LITAGAVSVGFVLGGIFASGKIAELEDRLQINDKFVAEISRELRDCKILLAPETSRIGPPETIDVTFQVMEQA